MRRIKVMVARPVNIALLVMTLGLLGAAIGESAASAAPPKLTVTKSAPSATTAGSIFDYTIKVLNNGPPQSTSTTLVDAMPANTTAFAVRASQGSCTISPSQKVTCALGTIASGSTATVKITASVSQAGTVANSATASNAQGSTAMGSATTHVTPASPPSGGAPPTATTGPASGISNTSATLGGQIAPGNQSTSYFFQYGTNTSYGRITAIQQTGTSQTVMAVVKGLTPGTVYHFRLVATNDSGTSYGSDRTFKTTGSHFLGQLLLIGRTLTVRSGSVFARLWCNSTKACSGLFSITIHARLGTTHQTVTAVCTESQFATYRVPAHKKVLISRPVHGSCVTAIRDHNNSLGGKFTTRPRTAQKGVVDVVTLVLK